MVNVNHRPSTDRRSWWKKKPSYDQKDVSNSNISCRSKMISWLPVGFTFTITITLEQNASKWGEVLVYYLVWRNNSLFLNKGGGIQKDWPLPLDILWLWTWIIGPFQCFVLLATGFCPKMKVKGKKDCCLSRSLSLTQNLCNFRPTNTYSCKRPHSKNHLKYLTFSVWWKADIVVVAYFVKGEPWKRYDLSQITFFLCIATPPKMIIFNIRTQW